MAPRANQCHAMAASTKQRCKKTCIDGELFCCQHENGRAIYPKDHQACQFIRPRIVYRAKPGRYPKRNIAAVDYRNNGSGADTPKMPLGLGLRLGLGMPMMAAAQAGPSGIRRRSNPLKIKR